MKSRIYKQNGSIRILMRVIKILIFGFFKNLHNFFLIYIISQLFVSLIKIHILIYILWEIFLMLQKPAVILIF